MSEQTHNSSLKFKNNENKRKTIVIEEDEPMIEKQVKLNNDDQINNNDCTPWYTRKTSSIKHPTLRLHNEIIEFYEYITPSVQEHQRRVTAFERVQKYFQDCVPGCKIETFGSFRTKLYLPNADIDMVMMDDSASSKGLYKKVATALMNQQQKFENINLIANAKVPIIKFIESESQLHFDLSFNKEDGLKQISEIEIAFKVYPEMKYLLMILKCILRQRDLHETYSGGIGSFLLFQMILAFLREMRKELARDHKIDTLKNITLGEYLLKFLEFFGLKFDINKKRIIMIGGGSIVNKPNQDDRFSLISPQDPDHDVGHSSYKAKEIFKIFQNRVNFMTNYNFKPGESVLRYIVNPCDQPFTYIKF